MDLSTDQILELALSAHAEERLQEAEALYQSILKFQPDHPHANYNLGLLVMSLGQTENALQLFINSITANPNIEQFWFTYVECLIELENFKDVAKMLSELKQAGASIDELATLETKAEKARAAQGGGKQTKLTVSKRREKISEKKKRKRQRPPHNQGIPPEQELTTLLQLYQGGQLAQAEQLALHITNSFPEHQFGWKVLGAIFKETGRLEESLLASQKSVQLLPDDAEARNNLGATAQEMGKIADAETCYRTAISLDKNHAGAHANLGIVLQKQGKLLEAELALRSAVALQPSSADHHYNLAIVLSDLGKRIEAEAQLRETISKNPNHAEAFNNLGILLFTADKVLEAKKHFSSAIRLKQDFADAHYNFGVALKALGDLKEARECFSVALTLRPNFEDALIGRSELLFENGDYEEALKDADSCTSEASRLAGLQALLALDRVDEIFNRLHKYSESSGQDLRMAAFASFISQREGKDAHHNFCPNPLNFICRSKISHHVATTNVFLDNLVAELLAKDVLWEPSGKSTHGGYQTQSPTLFETAVGSLAQLKNIILQEVDNYYQQFRDEACLFIQRWPKQPALKGWHVVLKPGGFQTPHIHPDGWLSGVIYLEVVPGLQNNEGAIEFSLNSKNYYDAAMPTQLYEPKRGDIILFPSSLHHRTIPFTTEAERIIVSFDVMPPSYEKDQITLLPNKSL